MEMWQKCPICNGSGQIANVGTCTVPFTLCPTCKGWRIISVVSGSPPANLIIDNTSSDAKLTSLDSIRDKLKYYTSAELSGFGITIQNPNAAIHKEYPDVTSEEEYTTKMKLGVDITKSEPTYFPE